jgi:hypothetical protein
MTDDGNAPQPLCLQVIEELGGDEVDEALLTFQCMDHGETPRRAAAGSGFPMAITGS